MPAEFEAFCSRRNFGLTALSAEVELEVSQLEPEEQKNFLDDLGITEPARDKFVRAAYALLDLISFFTIGPKEVRAWTITSGDSALVAAGKIHSDMQRGFIRAEVTAYDDFVSTGGWKGARDQKKARLEGKEYIVKDGDVVLFRFNV